MNRFREKCVTDRQTNRWTDKQTHGWMERPKFIGTCYKAEFKIQMFAKHQNILRGCPRLCIKNKLQTTIYYILYQK